MVAAQDLLSAFATGTELAFDKLGTRGGSRISGRLDAGLILEELVQGSPTTDRVRLKCSSLMNASSG
jgi:hypothetical protein